MSDENAQKPDENSKPSEIDALKTQVNQLSTTLEEYKSKTSRYEQDLAYRAREIEQLNEKLASKGGKKDSDSNVDGLKAQLETEISERYSSKIQEQDSAIGSLTSQLKELRVTNVAMSEAAKHFDGGLDLIKMRVMAECDWDSDKNTIIVRDGEGKTRYSKVNAGQPMSISEYMEGLAGEYPGLKRATVKSGVGTHGQRPANGTGESAKSRQEAAKEYLRRNGLS